MRTLLFDGQECKILYRAAGDAILPMVVSIGSMWICRLGCAYLLGIYFGWGLLGVWTAMAIDWVFRGIFFMIRFRSGRWEKVEKNNL